MGCGNSSEKQVNVLYSSGEESDEEILNQKALAFNELNRKELINIKKIKKGKKKFHERFDKLNTLLRHPYIAKDILLVKREEDYTVFYNKHEDSIRSLDFNKKSFKAALWNLRAREAILVNFYLEKLNLRDLIKERLLDSLDTLDEISVKLVKALFDNESDSGDLGNAIKYTFPESIFKENTKAFFWNGNSMNKDLKDCFINNLVFADDDFIYVEKIKHYSLLLTSDDLRQKTRLIKLGYVMSISKPRSIYICLKPIGDNYNKSIKYTYDSSSISVLLEDILQMNCCEAFLISAPQYVDYCFNKDIISLLVKISNMKSMKFFGSLRMDYDQESAEDLLFGVYENKNLIGFCYEPGIMKERKEKYFRWLFTRIPGITDHDELETFFGSTKINHQNKDIKKKVGKQPEGRLKMLLLFGTEDVSEKDRETWVENYRSNGFNKLEWIFWETSILTREMYY